MGLPVGCYWVVAGVLLGCHRESVFVFLLKVLTLGGPQSLVGCGAAVSMCSPALLVPTLNRRVAEVGDGGRSVESKNWCCWYLPSIHQEGPDL